MPAGTGRYYPPGMTEARELDSRADTERKEREEKLSRYWSYYDGDHHKPLVVRVGEPDGNIIINLCAQAIDKLLSFTAPSVPKATLPAPDMPVTPGQPAPQHAAQPLLDALWNDNDQRMEFMVELLLSGFVSGHAYTKLVLPDLPGDPPDVASLDARHVTTFWDVMSRKRVQWHRLQWQIDAHNSRRQDIVPSWMLADDPIYDPQSTWAIIEYEQTQRHGGKWREIGRDEWRFPFSPVVQWKNFPRPHDFYGDSFLKHYRINDALNFIASNTGKIIKHHAHPKEIIIGATVKQIDNSIDGVLALPDGADAKTIEMHGDLASSIAFYDLLRASFFTQSRVVDWAAQKDKVGQLTNFGLRVLFNDMVDLVTLIQSMYGRGLAEMLRRLLIVAGAPEDIEKPELAWEDSLPINRAELVQAAADEQALGITSDQSLAEDLGRDYQLEQERRGEEGTNGADNFADILTRIGQRGGFGSQAFNRPMVAQDMSWA